tara:strand:- start:856 stop:1404 length:549 start_codon:yes stop_codon:yes gene_type:complete
MLRHLLLTLALCLLSTEAWADEDGTNSQADHSPTTDIDFQFDGVWKPKGAILGGDFVPPPALEAIRLTIQKNRYEVTVQGEEQSDRGLFTLDKSVLPKRMTIEGKSGPNKGKTILAIYEIKGVNAMRVCYDLSGQEFPEEFKAPKGSQRYLVGYRRQTTNATDTLGMPAPSQHKPNANSNVE